MIVRAIWEFDVDDSEMDEEWVDVDKLCKELTKRELDYLLKHNELDAEDFNYECHPELPSDWDEDKHNQIYEKRNLEDRTNYYGIEGIGYIGHGEWADPEIEYKGELFNEHIITDPMYDRFYADFPEKDGDYDAFEHYVYDHRNEVYELLEHELFKIRSDENAE